MFVAEACVLVWGLVLALLTSFTGPALCFAVITFPMTRLADRLLKRDAARMRVGGR